MRSIAFIVCVASTQTSAQTGPVAGSVLNQLLNDVRTAYNRQEQPMVVFDVDGTLLDNRPRTHQILKEYGDVELKGVRPEFAKVLATLRLDQIQYRLTDTLAGVGITEEAVVTNAAVFWSQRFFNDAYLKYDVPTPGSVNYLRTLYSSGARVVYLSGRDAPRQLLGTVKSLRDNGFPIGIQSTELIMKPTIQTQDPVFKQNVTAYLRHYGKVLATFDSEPANANVYRRAFGEALVVRFETAHAPDPPALLPNIVSIKSFESK